MGTPHPRADAAADLAGVARPGAEPVLFAHPDHIAADCSSIQAMKPGYQYDGDTPLYTAQPQASQPLTGDEIDQMWREATIKPALTSEFVRTFARAIEQAHGIGAAQKGKP